MVLNLKPYKEGIQFAATIQPRSSKNEICGLHGDTLKIRLTSPPVEGEANRACVKFIAKFLGATPSRVTIVSGLAGQKKTIRIEGMNASEFFKKFQPLWKTILEQEGHHD